MNAAPELNWLTHGSSAPLPAVTPLQAGPLSLVFSGGDLRYLKLGGREVIRRVYGAIRDHNWGTVPAELTDLTVETSREDFRITYTATHRQGEIHFVWEADIIGAPDGSVRFVFEGEARSTFLRNRIGLCVLHPIRECAGANVRATHTDGCQTALAFPRLVAAEQPITGFQNLAGLAHEVEPGVWAELEFNGDVFETEDQRNWIDASFKTFSTPLSLPRPVEILAGTRVRQQVTLRLRGAAPAAVKSPVFVETGPIVLAERSARACRLPELGLGVASHGMPLSEREIARLSRLGLSHLRVDLALADPAWTQRLRTAARDAMELGTALELAIRLPRQGPPDFTTVTKELSRLKADLTRALIFREGEKSTLLADLEAAQATLPDYGLAVGTGTDADLYHFNLQRPPATGDFLCWSMNPQVHAFDCASVAETPEGVRHQLTSVHACFPDMPLVVSPVSLKPRFNPVATIPGTTGQSSELPPEVDPRQMSLFGAAWTLAMLKALAESDTESVTFYETTGWRGVMETQAGSALPDRFPSILGAVFPLYHVLADVADFCGGEVSAVEPIDSRIIAALRLRKGSCQVLLLANLTGEALQVKLPRGSNFKTARRLDSNSVLAAMTDPETFRRERGSFSGTTLELPGFGLVTLLGEA